MYTAGGRKRETPMGMLPDGSMMKQVCWENCQTQMHPAFLTAFCIPMMWKAIKLPSKKNGEDFQRRAAASERTAWHRS